MDLYQIQIAVNGRRYSGTWHVEDEQLHLSSDFGSATRSVGRRRDRIALAKRLFEDVIRNPALAHDEGQSEYPQHAAESPSETPPLGAVAEGQSVFSLRKAGRIPGMTPRTVRLIILAESLERASRRPEGCLAVARRVASELRVMAAEIDGQIKMILDRTDPDSS